MKKIILLSTIVIMFTMVKAQDRKISPEDRAERVSVSLQKKLKLDDTQKTKVHDILLNQANKVDSLRNLNKGSSEKRNKKQEVKTILDDSYSKINSLLNEDQKKAFEEWKKEKREHIKSRRRK